VEHKDRRQLDATRQEVAQVKARARPWRSIIALILAAIMAAVARSARGTGLVGLKDRIEALGGWISLHSPRDAGTTVRAELPLPHADAIDRKDSRARVSQTPT